MLRRSERVQVAANLVFILLLLRWGISHRNDDYRFDHEHIGLHENNQLSRVAGNSLIKMEAGIRVKNQVYKSKGSCVITLIQTI